MHFLCPVTSPSQAMRFIFLLYLLSLDAWPSHQWSIASTLPDGETHFKVTVPASLALNLLDQDLSSLPHNNAALARGAAEYAQQVLRSPKALLRRAVTTSPRNVAAAGNGSGGSEISESTRSLSSSHESPGDRRRQPNSDRGPNTPSTGTWARNSRCRAKKPTQWQSDPVRRVLRTHGVVVNLKATRGPASERTLRRLEHLPEMRRINLWKKYIRAEKSRLRAEQAPPEAIARMDELAKEATKRGEEVRTEYKQNNPHPVPGVGWRSKKLPAASQPSSLHENAVRETSKGAGEAKNPPRLRLRFRTSSRTGITNGGTEADQKKDTGETKNSPPKARITSSEIEAEQEPKLTKGKRQKMRNLNELQNAPEEPRENLHRLTFSSGQGKADVLRSGTAPLLQLNDGERTRRSSGHPASEIEDRIGTSQNHHALAQGEVNDELLQMDNPLLPNSPSTSGQSWSPRMIDSLWHGSRH